MKISNREIGLHEPPYIIAEIGSNHGGSAYLGKSTIRAAKDAGASAVKLQCYTADSIAIKGDIKVESDTWKGANLYDLYKSAETPPNLVQELFDFAKTIGIDCFASVFDFEGVDFVDYLGMPAIKIASFELVDTPLIEYAAITGLPMMISTGMGTSEEIRNAVNAYNYGNGSSTEVSNLALLHCVSNYPASPKEANLPALGPLSRIYGQHNVVGFSDHTIGVVTAVAAVAYGASIIEKHFTLDRSDGGPDSSFSMEPVEFQQLVEGCNAAWQAIQPSVPSTPNLAYRKSIFVTQDVACGDSLTKENCRILRPACGLSPKLYASVLAGVATRDLKAGTPLQASMVSTLC